MRTAISITVDEDNLLWLKAQAAASAKGTLSAVVDRLIAEARAQGGAATAAMQSVAGTIDLPDDDPDLEQASAYVRTLFEQSLRRRIVVKEEAPKPAGRGARRRG